MIDRSCSVSPSEATIASALLRRLARESRTSLGDPVLPEVLSNRARSGCSRWAGASVWVTNGRSASPVADRSGAKTARIRPVRSSSGPVTSAT